MNFVTLWALPEPIYRRLGRLYPQFSFSVEAIDPDCWAIEGRLHGHDAEFRESDDFDAMFDRFYSVIGRAADRGEALQRAGLG